MSEELCKGWEDNELEILLSRYYKVLSLVGWYNGVCVLLLGGLLVWKGNMISNNYVSLYKKTCLLWRSYKICPLISSLFPK